MNNVKSKIKQIISNLILLSIISGIFFGIGYILYNAQKPVLDITITTGFDENETLKITNVSFVQSYESFIYKTIDSQANFPEINIIARNNEFTSEPISYWASTKYNPARENTYVVRMTFRNEKEPKTNDTLILPIKMTDHKGKIVYKTTAFYEWR